MSSNINEFAFGPIPSRRLGTSLGVNNIPPKTCSYSCVYCQLGRTTDLMIETSSFYSPEDVSSAVRKKIEHLKGRGKGYDYVTLVPDGEPTLDAALADLITLLQDLNGWVAVITNSSLLWSADIRNSLFDVDLISVKIDAVDPEVWRELNRPHPSLEIGSILRGIQRLSDEFEGDLITETMLVSG